MSRHERGSVLVYVAVSLVAILGMMALAVDVGIAYVQRRRARTAADAAGLAAVSLMAKHVSGDEILDAIEAYVDANGSELEQATYVGASAGFVPVPVERGANPPGGATGVNIEASAASDTYFAGLFTTMMLSAGSGMSTEPTPTPDPLATTVPVTATWHMTASAVSEAQYQPLDIVLVMDISGSMDDDSRDMNLPWATGYGKYQYRDWEIQKVCDWRYDCGYVWNGSRWVNQCGWEYVCEDEWVEVWRTVREEPLGQAQDAARYFVSLNDSELTRIGLASYATYSYLDLHLSDDFSTVNDAIGGLTANGWTYIRGGMQQAYSELENNGRANAKKVIILLSDGVANCTSANRCSHSYNSQAESLSLEVARAARDDGYLIYTISLGTECHEEFMRDLAGSSDRAFYAPDGSELQHVYEEIFANIQFRLSL